MSKEIPILFSTPMVQAIMAGKKTMTRRIIKNDLLIEKQKYHEGDLLWVRETWQKSYNSKTDKWDAIFKADGFYFDEDGPTKWKPSIFLKKEDARIWLEVTNVRLENLQDITDGDVAREGVIWNEPLDFKREKRNCNSPAQRAFRRLWDKINGIDSWDKNPFLYSITFKVLSKTGKP